MKFSKRIKRFFPAIFFIPLIFLSVLYSGGCSEREDAKSLGAKGEDYQLTSKEIRALRERVSEGPRRKVVVLGFDAASWNIVDPLIKTGKMPHLKKLLERSAYGDLLSLPFFITPPAWTSMFSGCKAWKTGIYSFTRLDSASRKPLIVSSRDVKVPRLWDMASEAGLKTAVIRVPLTYPASPVNGIMLTGFLTPGRTIVRKQTGFKKTIRKIKKQKIKKYGLKSFSLPAKAELKVYGSDVTVFLLNSRNKGSSLYDSAFVIVHASETIRDTLNGEVSTVVIPKQTASCSLDAFTPWLKVLVYKDNIPCRGWVRLMPALPGSISLNIWCSPVYGHLSETDVEFCYPDSLRKEIADRFERFTPNVSHMLPLIRDQIYDDAEYLEYFYNYDDWDLFIFQFQVTDIIQHRNGEGPYTQDVYAGVDKILGDFIAGLPKDAVLVLASDHGGRGYSMIVHLNAWLNKLGLIARKSSGEVDFKHSIALYFDWGIYINRPELEKKWHSIRGFSPKSRESVYEDLVDFLIEKAKSIAGNASKKRLLINMRRATKERDELAPDIIVRGEYPDYFVKQHNRINKVPELIGPPYQDGHIYFHRRKGLFVISGRGIKKGFHAGVQNIYDIAPTILYLLGLPQADYFDGKVMESVFEDTYLSRYSTSKIRTYSLTKRESEEKNLDTEKLEEKLRAIGYVQ